MKLRLRPTVVALGRRKLPLRRFEIEAGGGTVQVSLVSGSASPGLIHDVDRIAPSQEELRPTLAAVWRAREVGSRLRAAVDHDDGPGVRLFARDLELGIELAAHDLPAVHGRILPAREQVALTRDRQRRRAPVLRQRRHYGSHAQDERDTQCADTHIGLLHKRLSTQNPTPDINRIWATKSRNLSLAKNLPPITCELSQRKNRSGVEFAVDSRCVKGATNGSRR